MSMTIRSSAGEESVRSGELSLDLRGNWIAVLELAAASASPAGDVELVVVRELGGPDTFRGFVRRGALEESTGVARVVVVGGKGKLGAVELAPRDHVAGVASVTAGLVARGIADAAGEVLAPGVEAKLDELALDRWTRARGTGVEAIEHLAHALDLSWRVLASGEIWIGSETWPAGDLAVERLDEAHDDGAIDARPDGAQLRPGTVIAGRRVRRVTYRITESALRAELLYDVEGDVVHAPERGVYSETLLGSIVSQNADGTIEVEVFDERVEGLSKVRLDVGIPGASVVVEPRTQVRIAFRGHDPRGAYAYGIAQDPAASAAVSLVGDSCGFLTAICAAPGSPATLAISPVYVPNSVEIKVLGPGSQGVKLR